MKQGVGAGWREPGKRWSVGVRVKMTAIQYIHV